jgi:hypothetical protein
VLILKKDNVKCKGEATLHIITTPRKIQKIEKKMQYYYYYY